MGLLSLMPLKKKRIDLVLEACLHLKLHGFDQTASAAYIFGSATTDRFNAESDIDILVVFRDIESLSKAQLMISKTTSELWTADWVFKTQEDFDRRSEIGGVCFTAKNSGVKIL
jgi:hypothetical protein